MAGYPLRGLRVVELTWFIAGPLVGRWLADQGADVVKVETPTRADPARGVPPFPAEVPPPARTVEMSGWFNSYNAGVRSVALDLATDSGLGMLRGLIAESDVFLENFTPGTVERWGLGYDGVRALRSDIVMVRMPLVGSEGPRAGLAGGGNHLTALGGLMSRSGPLGGAPSPVGPRGIMPDHATNPLNATIAILAALRHRRRTGRGQLIEIPQLESVAGVMGPALLEHQLTGVVRGVEGNRSPAASPHNAYRCRDGSDGRERWLALAVHTDDEWVALSGALGERALADPRFAGASGRKAHEEEIDAALSAWCGSRAQEEALAVLRQAGVPCAPVRDGEDLLADPQLASRGHYSRPPHEGVRTPPLARLGFRIEGALHGPRASAPHLGEHTAEVLSEVLGLGAAELDERARGGAFG